MALRVGDTVIRQPDTIMAYDKKCRTESHNPMEGKVVYIHPKDRFHVVEFELGMGRTARESFQGVWG